MTATRAYVNKQLEPIYIYTRWPQKSKLLHFVHIFAKY